MNKKEVGKLILIWILTNLSVALFGWLVMDDGKQDVEGTFMFFIIASMLSIPAVVFFTLISYRVLKTQKNIWTAKLIILMINYIDIIATIIVLRFSEDKGIGFRIIMPLIIGSTIWIFIMPLKLIQREIK